MANEHMKRCLPSLDIRDAQIKTRYHYIIIRMATIKKTVPHSGKDTEQLKLHALLVAV